MEKMKLRYTKRFGEEDYYDSRSLIFSPVSFGLHRKWWRAEVVIAESTKDGGNGGFYDVGESLSHVLHHFDSTQHQCFSSTSSINNMTGNGKEGQSPLHSSSD